MLRVRGIAEGEVPTFLAAYADPGARLELGLYDDNPYIVQLAATCKSAGFILAQAKTSHVLEHLSESHNAVPGL